jgi:uncharacterized protein (UPF0212 family)
MSMTENEAINVLQLNKPFTASKEANNAIEMAIQALEKQMPKKPQEISWGATKCSICGQEFGFNSHFNHCSNCGQKLDW